MSELEKQETIKLLGQLRKARPSALANFKLSGQGRFVPPKTTDQTNAERVSEPSPIDQDEKTSAD